MEEMMNQHKSKGKSMFVWIVLIVIVALLLVFTGKNNSNTDIVDPSKDAQVQEYQDTSNSDEIADIEQDIDDTSFEDIDSDLQ